MQRRAKLEKKLNETQREWEIKRAAFYDFVHSLDSKTQDNIRAYNYMVKSLQRLESRINLYTKQIKEEFDD